MANAKSRGSPTDEVFRQAWPGSTTRISYGSTFPQACARHVRDTFKAHRVYVIASGSLSRNTDHVKRLQQALGDRVAGIRHGMKPYSMWSEILEVAEEARKAKADLLVTLGAGSLTDASKIIALILGNNVRTFDDLIKLQSGTRWQQDESRLNAPMVPIISIPTSLSGGEYNFFGGGTNDRDNIKYSFSHPTKGPTLVILDPDLTTTTPERTWLSSGVRAVDHCVECLCSLEGTQASDADAEHGLQLLLRGLLRCKKDSNDLAARFDCQIGVIEALKAMNLHGIQMGASHGIGHQLGPMGVGHGETSCILLPAVCKYNASVNEVQQARVRAILWAEPEVRGMLEAAGLRVKHADLGDMLDIFFRSLGMPRSLSEVGIGGEEKLNLLAQNSLSDRWVRTNPRPLTERRQVLEILELANR